MATTTNAVISTNNLTKMYHSRRGEVLALDKLNLEVRKGEIFGYLGPNGAGKTTTIRLLIDLIRPTAGGAKVLGMDAQADSVQLHQHIGFLPGELNLWKNLTGLQVVTYLASVRGDTVKVVKQAHELAERLELDMSLKVREYSSGNKRKLGLVTAMMHKPELLILDEPTSGLDPLVQQTFHQMVREARQEGRTVFLSSHVLSEVQAVCDRVGILRKGLLKAVERIEDITHTNFRWVTVKFRESAEIGGLANVPGVTDVSVEGDSVKFQLNGDFDPLLRAIGDRYVVDLRVHEPSLEEIFLAFYGNDNGAAKEA
jgi:ABC-2 type transport system ATP-binding protein